MQQRSYRALALYMVMASSTGTRRHDLISLCDWYTRSRDLKPENVLIGRDGHIVLTDFGLSKRFKEDETPLTHTFCGTAEYLAPEILLGEAYGFVVDFWSLGTLIYEMLSGIVSNKGCLSIDSHAYPRHPFGQKHISTCIDVWSKIDWSFHLLLIGLHATF